MPEPLLIQQSRHYAQFGCIGANCEDTCCEGWQINVDRKTYEKYQQCSHPVLRPQLQQWVQIQPAAPNENTFAKIVLTEARCPFLSDRLCSIQKQWGEEHLGNTCATFPRIHNQVAGVIERSLDLSCPEAARLVLSDPHPATFHQIPGDQHHTGESGPEQMHPYFWDIRSTLLTLLQDRRYPIAKRLLLVGHVCDKLSELSKSGNEASVPQVLAGFSLGIEAGLYDAYLQACSADAATQLTIILQLMTGRMELDFTPQRYRDLYQAFVENLHLQPGMSVQEAGHRYANAYAGPYTSFLQTHEHMLEHYIVHYAYKTLFPFGLKALNAFLPEEHRRDTFTTQYLLMASHFALVQGFLIGMAAGHGSDLKPEQAIRCLQVCARTLEHCTTYPSFMLQVLRAYDIERAVGMSILTQAPQLRERSMKPNLSFVVAGGR
jgi:lysine-N-methylase